MRLRSRIRRFLANDKKTYDRLQAQRWERRATRDEVIDERLDEGFPSADVAKGWGWSSFSGWF
jgi:hypothetical protein